MKPGDLVADRFEIQALAGSGAMGRVFRALDRRSGTHVALKVMASDAPGDRFEREAEVLAELDHPGIVRYVAHGFAKGELYLVMEWLEGEDLASRLGRGALDPSDALIVVGQAAAALGAAHARGVVHRDVKPSNLFLVDGRLDALRLVDFGLAAVRFSSSKGQLTQAGLMLGTPPYMAPEQVRCERKIDARADVFALGCVLFECLTGRCPFDGPTPLAIFAKILVDEAPPPSDLAGAVPYAVDELVHSMLRKVRDERPSDGRAVADQIERIASVSRGHEPARAPSLTRLEQRLVSVVLLADVLAPRIADEPSVLEALARAPTMLDIPSVTDTMLDEMSRDLPEDPRLAEIRTIAAPFGGEALGLPGGSVVIVHRAGEGLADPASRAARSALVLHAAFPSVVTALATGRSSTGQVRVVGEALDRASSLVTLPVPARGVRIDHVSQGLLEARFELAGDDAGSLLVAERMAARAERTLLGRKTACVGRENELRALLDSLSATIVERKARATLVSAAAGVGKSRLRYELLRRAAVEAPDARVWVGWADPMGAGSPFGLLGPLVRRLLGLSEAQSQEERRAAVLARVERSVAANDSLRVSEFLGELVGVHFPDEGRHQLRAARGDAMLLGDQMLRAFSDFVAAETALGPLVIVLEDIHWGDLPSLRFIDGALERARTAPLFVFALGRPEMLTRFPGLWSAHRVSHVTLAELDPEASRALVVNALGSADERLVSDLVERAAGNAFYLEELVRAVADGRGISLPSTVLAVAQARLEGLSDVERRVLRAASVFGASFTKGGVLELLGGPTFGDLDEHLQALALREIIVASPDRFQDGHERRYGFRHALLCDAAYAMLTPEDCELGHRLAGEWLERSEDGDPPIIAEHFERGGAPSRAVRWYVEAAQQALEGNDFEAAKVRVARGFACGATGAFAGRLHRIAAEACRWTNDNALAGDHAYRAMQLLEVGTPTWYDAAGEAALGLGRQGRFVELGEVARALAASRALAPTPSCVAAMARASDQLLFAGEHALYRDLLETFEALTSGERSDPVVATWRTYVEAGVAMMRDASEYVVKMRDLVSAFEDLGDVRNTTLQRVNLADAYNHVGHYLEAATLSRESIAEAAALHSSLMAANAKCNLAKALAELGQLPEALAVANEVAAEMRLASDHRMEAAALGTVALVLTRSGNLAAAEDAAREALALPKAPPALRSCNLARLAEVLLAARRVSEARVAADEAFRILEELGTLDDGEAHVRLVHAEALLASGDTEGGRAAVGRARDRLLAQATGMKSVRFRSLFLTAIVEHQKTLSLAEVVGA